MILRADDLILLALMSKRSCAQHQLREGDNGREPALHAITTLLTLKGYEFVGAEMEVIAIGNVVEEWSKRYDYENIITAKPHYMYGYENSITANYIRIIKGNCI